MKTGARFARPRRSPLDGALTRACLWLVLVASVLGSRAAAQQCMDWRAVPGMTRADIIEAATLWDPDGDGPLSPRLVVAGRFTVAGWPTGIPANNIAMWDGTAWQPLGLGVSGNEQYAAIYTLAVFAGELYAGGTFTSAGGSPITGIARWNGTSWRSLGTGIAGTPPSANLTYVGSMAVYAGELVVAGGFVSAGGMPMNGIARWNGTSWNPVSMLGAGINGGFTCLTVHNNELYAGGTFTTINGTPANLVAKWNPAGSWVPLGNAIPGGGIDPIYRGSTFTSSSRVLSLGSYAGELIVGGRFTSANGVPASCVARWDGTQWRSLGSGITSRDPSSNGFFGLGVRSFHVHQGQLIVGGRFGFAGGLTVNNIARWNGSAWSPLGEGLSSYPSAFGDEGVYALTTFNSRLFAGGVFVNSDELTLQSIAEWDGTRWQHVPGVLYSYNAQTYALAPWAGHMMVGGDFNVIWQPGFLGFDLVQWDGLGLSSPSFVPSWSTQGLLPAIRALASFPRTSGPPSDDLYVGGDFDQFSGAGATVPASRIARTNSLFGGWEPVGAGFNGTVHAITRFNGSVYAAGSFTASGGTARNRIARWDGTLWQPVVNQPTPGPDGTNDTVRAMVGYTSGIRNVILVVGGDFTTAGGVAANRVAQYNVNTLVVGATWSALGPGFNGTVNALARFNGSTYAAGNFTLSGSTPVSRIARWDGTAWQPVGGGVNGAVYALTVSNGTLVVGGNFTNAGGVPETENLARWDGSSWSSIGGGTEGTVRALASFNGELHVGGQFTTVRNGVIGSMGYARYFETGVPWFARLLTNSGSSCLGRDAFLSARIAQGYGGLRLEWRRNGVPLQDGPTGTGSTIAGSANFGLNILNLGFADSGAYQLVVSNACGEVVSNTHTLTICPADLDDGSGLGTCDGGVTIDDLLYYLELFGDGGLLADLDDGSATGSRDGGVTIDDLLFFLQHFADGC